VTVSAGAASVVAAAVVAASVEAAVAAAVGVAAEEHAVKSIPRARKTDKTANNLLFFISNSFSFFYFISKLYLRRDVDYF
jgi:hypothetical protein